MMSLVRTSVKCLFPTTKSCALDASRRHRLQYAIMDERPELLAIHRALDELSRQAHGLRHRFGNTLDVTRFAEDVARLRTDISLLPRGNPVPSTRPTRIPAEPENHWHDDEGLGGFASTLGRSA
jgi:hypothetical protein